MSLLIISVQIMKFSRSLESVRINQFTFILYCYHYFVLLSKEIHANTLLFCYYYNLRYARLFKTETILFQYVFSCRLVGWELRGELKTTEYIFHEISNQFNFESWFSQELSISHLGLRITYAS